MRSHLRPRSRRAAGMATFAAVMMLSIVMLSLTALTHYFAQQARYTRDEMSDAQLRQLLLAGQQWASQNMNAIVTANNSAPGAFVAREVPLPQTLRDAGGSLRVEQLSPSANAGPSVRITACIHQRQMTQIVSYAAPTAALTNARLHSGQKIPPASIRD